MEIFSFHKGLNKLVEVSDVSWRATTAYSRRANTNTHRQIGNSGMFRPEMLEAMGLPKDLRVFGFGLSLERPTMIKYAISNIRELLGHQVDLNFVEKNAAVRLDKN